jgi:5-(carboxyamino)imidazole ribonucleotide mutase
MRSAAFRRNPQGERTTSVLIVLGSKTDIEVAAKACDTLEQFSVPYELRVCSAHRTPRALVKLIEGSDAQVFIAVAGMAAALPGVVAAHTVRPVIGLPVGGKVPFDSLLSTVQMPPGVPVASVGVDRGENAALLAVQILALKDPALSAKLEAHRKDLEAKTAAGDAEVTRKGPKR